MQDASTGEQAVETTAGGLEARVLEWRQKQWALEGDDGRGWFVVVDGELHGPIARQTLIEVLAEHAHSEQAPLWNAAHAFEWITLAELPQLFTEVVAARATPRQGRHPADAPRFATGSLDPEALVPSHEGVVDVPAALHAMLSAPVLPTRAEPPAPAQPPLAVPVHDPFESPKPVLRPVARRSRSHTWANLRAGGGGVVVGALLGLVVLVAWAPGSREVEPEAYYPSTVASPPAAIVEAEPVPTAVTPARPAAAPIAPTRAPAREPRRPRHHAPDRSDAPVAFAAPAAMAARPSRAQEPRAHASRSIDDLLVAAVADHPGARAEAPRGPHASPSRAEIARALEAFRDEVRGCTQVHDVATIRVTFRGDTGRVGVVSVDGRFAGTTAGRCIADAVRGAHVEPFTRSTFDYAYPFRL